MLVQCVCVVQLNCVKMQCMAYRTVECAVGCISESNYSPSSAKSANFIDKDSFDIDVADIYKLNTHGGSCIFSSCTFL